MRRVVATLRPRRNSVVMSSSDGKTEKSRGFSRLSDTSRISTEIPMLNASRMSSAKAGSGRIRIASTPRTAIASSPWPVLRGVPVSITSLYEPRDAPDWRPVTR
jgi:hypothetical protein